MTDNKYMKSERVQVTIHVLTHELTTLSLKVDLNHSKYSKPKTFYRFSQALTKTWARKTAFSKGIGDSIQGRRHPKQRRNMWIPSLSETQTRHRTRCQLGDFLWIQEISWTWYIAMFMFEYEYRIPRCMWTREVDKMVSSEQARTGK